MRDGQERDVHPQLLLHTSTRIAFGQSAPDSQDQTRHKSQHRTERERETERGQEENREDESTEELRR